MAMAKKFKTGRSPGSKKKSRQDCMVTRNKRKTRTDPQSTRKRQRGACKRTEVPLEPVKGNGTKRKADSKAETPCKRPRVNNNKTDTGEPTKVPVKTESSISKTTSVTSRDFEDKYQQLDKLGEGGFGAVYAGYRKSDSLPVAIKHIPRADACLRRRTINRKKCMISNEVLLMQRVASGPDSVGKSAAVSLLDWYILDQEVVLVMERPFPCTNLYEYLTGPMDENQAKIIMRQLVEAVIEMHSEGIFHRDIKTENILIETGSEVPRVRLIDFGCGCLVKKGPYRWFSGTSAYAPPEFFKQGRYEAGPTTVWQLGALLYELLYGVKQFTTSKFMRTRTEFTSKLSSLSKDCQHFLRICLHANPKQRATLQHVQLHPWLK